jgi:hypothetical protein
LFAVAEDSRHSPRGNQTCGAAGEAAAVYSREIPVGTVAETAVLSLELKVTLLNQ